MEHLCKNDRNFKKVFISQFIIVMELIDQNDHNLKELFISKFIVYGQCHGTY